MDVDSVLPSAAVSDPRERAGGGAARLTALMERSGHVLGVQSIRTKVLVALVVLTLVTAAVLVYVSATVVKTALLQERLQRGQTIQHVVETLFAGEADLRGPWAERRLATIAEAGPDIRQVAILVPEGQRWRVAASSRSDALLDLLEIGVAPTELTSPVLLPVPGDGDDSHYYLAPLPGHAQPGPALLLENDTAAIQRTLNEILRRTVQLGVVGVVILGGVLIWGSEFLLLRPIRQLHWLASELEQGKLQVRSGISRPDEIGHLASALDQMAAALERAAEENRQLYRELEQRFQVANLDAITDYLTELFNHRYLQLRLEQELAQTARQRTSLSLLLLDIDHFKALNDAYGHPVGDQILAKLAGLIRSSVRAMDIPCRYGGEEFAILLPGTGSQEALAVAERIRRAIAGHLFQMSATSEDRVTVSIGVATALQDATDRDGLLKAVDDALYYAKRMGRNQVWAWRDIVVEETSANRPEWWEQLQLNAIRSLATVVDVRDAYTHHHGDQVARLATTTGRALGLSAADLRALMLAGTVHDVGKIGIPDRILGKAGPLTDDERSVIKGHPALGEHILQQVRGLEEIALLVRAHHERWDGAGYPDGLKGEEIPLLARVLAVADAFHAMTSDRPYRKALAVARALRELRREAGRQLDPQVVEAFCQAVERGDLDTVAPSERAEQPCPHAALLAEVQGAG
ncbi:MAG: diguanylate cyclase [Chloroflexi bacterium]|nr:diguanylate cyclase [Chloroflexota bacterium]